MLTKTISLFGSLALALTLTSTSASASASDKSAQFIYTPAELATHVGAEQVYTRLHGFAKNICVQEFDRYAPRDQLNIRRCTFDIKREVVAAISHSNLDKVSQSIRRP